MPLVSRAGHLKEACAPSSWYHGLEPTRLDAEDHQLNEQLLAACWMSPPVFPLEPNFIQGSEGLISDALADEK